ncbi:hypothetical protein BHE90_012232 [Fusarium euwallaceae]|uniref:Uncharacterized protein n=4 Tax=Fusarium solani species complex TaxID=232080 RepID=A0A3M2RUL8_9HYPO|nr:hypothetical protein CDV36_011411 [Fusarium kuroshium]RSL77354.1 hypothetical protein CEP51_009148 [Fusarium floridanum]RSM13342.1 hypothetical protein CEP52_001869 [Fusarium oligoseptatum]RTE73349.1 hypothetical protein BHE90_012232 [Fusarium euwallaceae]
MRGRARIERSDIGGGVVAGWRFFAARRIASLVHEALLLGPVYCGPSLLELLRNPPPPLPKPSSQRNLPTQPASIVSA